MEKSKENLSSYFDTQVDRFSNLVTGQQSIIDAPVMLKELALAAKTLAPNAKNILDIGCGGGNQTLNILSVLPELDCTLLDISPEMLNRAKDKISSVTTHSVETVLSDLRDAPLKENSYDIITACAVLHHLREEDDWRVNFKRLFNLLKDGGVLLVSDFLRYDNEKLQAVEMARWEKYLRETLGDKEGERILASVAATDTPRSLEFQISLLKDSGFKEVAVLHKENLFAAYCAVKLALEDK